MWCDTGITKLKLKDIKLKKEKKKVFDLLSESMLQLHKQVSFKSYLTLSRKQVEIHYQVSHLS